MHACNPECFLLAVQDSELSEHEHSLKNTSISVMPLLDTLDILELCKLLRNKK